MEPMEPMEPIVHITSAEAWQHAVREDAYHGDTLEREGFIHASTPGQVLAVANEHYWALPDPVLLVIDPRRVGPPVRYEDGGDGQLYPHIYGPLNLDAIVQVVPLPRGRDRYDALPPLLIMGDGDTPPQRA